MMRLFAAVEIPDDVRAELVRIQSGLPGARWSPPENLHITLCFIGQVQEPVAEEIADELSRVQVSPFKLRLGVPDTFGGERQNEKARILFASVEHDEALPRLAKKIEAAVRRLGVEVQSRKYRPHVTLARLKDLPPDRIGNYMRRHALFRSADFEVREFTLFQSILGHTSPTYHPLVVYRLD